MKIFRFIFGNFVEFCFAFILLYYALPKALYHFHNYQIRNETKQKIGLLIKQNFFTKEKAYHYFYGGNKHL